MKNFIQLSRAEMKNVRGGVAMVTCTWTGTCGANFPGTRPYDPSDTDAANADQDAADGWCEAASCCKDVDCPGAT